MRCEVNLVSQNHETNSSMVRVVGSVWATSGSSSDNTNRCKASITGTNSYGPVSANFSNLGTTPRVFVDQTFEVPHDPDGTKSVSYTFNWGPTITSNFGSGGSVTCNLTLTNIPRAPSQMVRPTLTYIAPTSIKAVSTPPNSNGSGIDLYHFLVDIYNPPRDDSPKFRVIPANIPNVTIPNLDIATRWCVQVAARNAYGWGPRSPVGLYTIGDVPAAPKLMSISTTPPNKVSITWTPPTDRGGSSIKGWVIVHQNYDTGAIGYIDVLGTDATKSFTFTLPPGATYIVRIAAKNSQGTGAFSNNLNILVNAGPKVRMNGVYKVTETYVRHMGVWRPAIPYVRDNGVWKLLTS